MDELRWSEEKIRQELGKISLNLENSYETSLIIRNFAIRFFGIIPFCYNFTITCGLLGLSDFYTKKDRLKNNINRDKTIKNIIKNYPKTIILEIFGEQDLSLLLVNNNFIIYNCDVYTKEKEFLNVLKSLFIYEDEQTRWFEWTYFKGNKIETVTQKISNKIKFEYENYNDDFIIVDNKIQKILTEEEPALVMLHGEPGTGKSTYLKHLISIMNHKNFYWLDSSIFAHITDSSFVQFLTTHCNDAIFIMEDCEKLLVSRNNSSNPLIQTLLSLTDGILGESLNLKFICTFNTETTNIDKALLRKGRLKLKYEFKKLSKNKVEAIFEKMNVDKKLAKPMPLCDIYNFIEDNGYEFNGKNKIGFV